VFKLSDTVEQPILVLSALDMRFNIFNIASNDFGNAYNSSKIGVFAGDVANNSLSRVIFDHRQAVLDARKETKELWLSHSYIRNSNGAASAIVLN
jgi:hypothetical protein